MNCITKCPLIWHIEYLVIKKSNLAAIELKWLYVDHQPGLRHWWVIHNYVIFSLYVICSQQHTYNSIQITHCAC